MNPVVWRVAFWLDAGICALVVMDPTARVAYIGGSALIIGNAILGWVGYLNYKATQESNRLAGENRDATHAMSINVDGNLKRLLDEKVKAATEHIATSEQLAHAEGRREELEVAEDKVKYGSEHK